MTKPIKTEPNNCSISGCPGVVRANGLCQAHYNKAYHAAHKNVDKIKRRQQRMKSYYLHRDRVNLERRMPCKICGSKDAFKGYCPQHKLEHQEIRRQKERVRDKNYNNRYQSEAEHKLDHAKRQREYLQTEKGKLAYLRKEAKRKEKAKQRRIQQLQALEPVRKEIEELIRAKFPPSKNRGRLIDTLRQTKMTCWLPLK